MLKAIRNINWGWMILLLGIVLIASGLSMTEDRAGEKTFLCFDNECIYIQGVSNIIVGFLSAGVGIYLILKK